MAAREPEAAGLSWADFSGQQRARFTLSAGAHEFEVVLEEADLLAGSVRPRGSFRLAFRGPGDPVLPQAIYRLRGPTGQHDMFLVPVGRDTSGTLYEAVFN